MDHISKKCFKCRQQVVYPISIHKDIYQKNFHPYRNWFRGATRRLKFYKGTHKGKYVKNKKMTISRLILLKIEKKTTFFSSTLKVGEEIVVLFFHFELKWARYGWLFVFLKNSNRSYFLRLGPAQDHPKMFTKLKIFFSCASMTTSITRKSHGKIDFLIFPK